MNSCRFLCYFWVGEDSFERAMLACNTYLQPERYDSSLEADNNAEFTSLFRSYLLSVFEELGECAKVVYVLYNHNTLYVAPTIININSNHKWIYDRSYRG
jgi:hypothetical protein